MTSRLQDIVAEFVTQLNDASVSVATGRKELHRNNAPPRIVFERVGGDVVMTQEIGRQDISPKATRQLWTRNFTTIMHCWGQDEEQAEQLMHNAVVAMHRAVGSGNIILGAESWGTEAEDGDVNLGEEVTIEIGLQIPILDQMLELRLQPIAFVKSAEFASTSGACG